MGMGLIREQATAVFEIRVDDVWLWRDRGSLLQQLFYETRVVSIGAAGSGGRWFNQRPFAFWEALF